MTKEILKLVLSSVVTGAVVSGNISAEDAIKVCEEIASSETYKIALHQMQGIDIVEVGKSVQAVIENHNVGLKQKAN